MPTVAIVMRSKNEQPYTEPALQALFEQTYDDFVLYNIDSGSTDGTMEVIRKYNKAAQRIVEIRPEDYVPGRVLNDMCAMTSEDIVVFLNADAIPQDRFWLESLLEPILKEEADASMSRQIARDSAYFIVNYDYERAYLEKNMKGENADFFSAVACAFKRELWEHNKFYTGGYAEDLAWARECRTQGYRFKLVLDSVVEHSHNYSIAGLYRKKFRHGVAYVSIYGEHAALIRQIYSCLRETARDLLHSLAKGCLLNIPYNLLYRITIHLAFYKGKVEGEHKRRLSSHG